MQDNLHFNITSPGLNLAVTPQSVWFSGRGKTVLMA